MGGCRLLAGLRNCDRRGRTDSKHHYVLSGVLLFVAVGGVVNQVLAIRRLRRVGARSAAEERGSCRVERYRALLPR